MVLNEKGIIKQFDLIIYPVNVLVAIGDVKEALEKEYQPADEKYVGFGAPTDEHPAITFEAIQKEGDIPCSMIWIKDLNSCKGSYMCHEVGHAALDIFGFIGAKVDIENQEPFCYLLGNIYRLVNGAYYEYKDFLEKKQTKKKKK